MPNTPPFLLDDLDRRILNALQHDSSVSNEALARQVHTSAPTCLRRVRRLYAEGIIEKQVAILNPAKLGDSITAICEITLDVQASDTMAEFEARLVAEPHILQCYRVSPGPDFVVIAQLPNMDAYRDLAHRVFTSSANVRNVRSFFSVYRAKFETGTPVQTSYHEQASPSKAS